MTIYREEASAEWPCPLARTFAETHKGCIGGKCPVWRWQPVSADDPMFQSAVAREKQAMAEERGKDAKPAAFHKEAVERVLANPERYSLSLKPTHGWCGLGGKP
jgi:hypothetical protein